MTAKVSHSESAVVRAWIDTEPGSAWYALGDELNTQTGEEEDLLFRLGALGFVFDYRAGLAASRDPDPRSDRPKGRQRGTLRDRRTSALSPRAVNTSGRISEPSSSAAVLIG